MFKKLSLLLSVITFGSALEVSAPGTGEPAAEDRRQQVRNLLAQAEQNGEDSSERLDLLKQAFDLALQTDVECFKTTEYKLVKARGCRAQHLLGKARLCDGNVLGKISFLQEALSASSCGRFIAAAATAHEELETVLYEATVLAQDHLNTAVSDGDASARAAALDKTCHLAQSIAVASKDLSSYKRQELLEKQQELWKKSLVARTETNKRREFQELEPEQVAQAQVRQWLSQAKKPQTFASKILLLRPALVLAQLCGLDDTAQEVARLLTSAESEIVQQAAFKEATVILEKAILQQDPIAKIVQLKCAQDKARISLDESLINNIQVRLKPLQEGMRKQAQTLLAKAQTEDNLFERVGILKDALQVVPSIEDVDTALVQKIEERFGAAKGLASMNAQHLQYQATDVTDISEKFALLEEASKLAEASENGTVVKSVDASLQTVRPQQLRALEEQLSGQDRPVARISILNRILTLIERMPIDRRQEKIFEQELETAKSQAGDEVAKLLQQPDCEKFLEASKLTKRIGDIHLLQEVRAKILDLAEQRLPQGEAENEPIIKVRLLQQALRLASEIGERGVIQQAEALLESMKPVVSEQINGLMDQANRLQNLEARLKILKPALQLARSAKVYDRIEGISGQINVILDELQGAVCGFCLEELTTNVIVLKCNPLHRLHRECYKKMSAAGQGDKCPHCRATI